MPLPESLRPKTLIDLINSDIPKPLSYIEPAILPVGGQLIVAAHAKTGKSFMALELGRALASADVPFGAPMMFCPRACRVLLVEQELGEFGLKDRAEKIYDPHEIARQGFMSTNFFFVSKVPELKLDTAKGCQLLYDLCEDVQPNVLILDPLGRMHNLNENDNQSVGQLWQTIDELQKMFKHNNMAVIVTMHMGKPADQRAGFDPLSPYQIRGASKNFDCVDSVITCDRTHDLATNHQSWSVTTRYTLRHGESPDDMILHVNERDDRRVRYFKTKGDNTLPNLVPKSTGYSGVQTGFSKA